MVEFLKKDIRIYQRAIKKYLPNKINYLFILESPPYPKKGVLSFFYLLSTPPKQSTLFKLFMRALYGKKFTNNDDKNYWLSKFKNDGFFLIDAVEYPINKDIDGNNLSDDEYIRRLEIRKNCRNLLEILKKLNKKNIITNDTKLILIKKCVFEELYTFLNNEGFNVIDKKVNYPNQYDYNFIKDIHWLVYRKYFKY